MAPPAHWEKKPTNPTQPTDLLQQELSSAQQAEVIGYLYSGSVGG